MIGWAAASGTTPLNAWLLCAIIFMWTPPHFWALSLYTSEDYAKAGVPMMPVVRGAASTRRQILVYSLIFVPLAILPAATGLGGPLYLGVSALGGAAFVTLAIRLARAAARARRPPSASGLYDVKAGAKDARNLFAFSIAYLFSLLRRAAGRAPGGRRGDVQMSDPFAEGAVAAKARKRRSLAIALALGLFVVLVFIVTIVRLKANALMGAY